MDNMVDTHIKQVDNELIEEYLRAGNQLATYSSSPNDQFRQEMESNGPPMASWRYEKRNEEEIANWKDDDMDEIDVELIN